MEKKQQMKPRFVAEMMGFPANWTELPFQSGETEEPETMNPIKINSSTAKMNWIKCGDMLPEIDGRYLTVCVESGHAPHPYDAELTDFEGGEWELTVDHDEPTHWLRIELPLPDEN